MLDYKRIKAEFDKWSLKTRDKNLFTTDPYACGYSEALKSLLYPATTGPREDHKWRGAQKDLWDMGWDDAIGDHGDSN